MLLSKLQHTQRASLAFSALCLVLSGCAGGGGSASNGSTGSTPVTTAPVTTAPAAAALTVTAVSPASVPVGSADLTLTVTGTGFANGATVLLNDVSEPTTFISATELRAVIAAAQLKTGSVLAVSVSSGTATVKADPAAAALSVSNPSPAVSSISPAAVLLGAADTTFTVSGTGLLGSTVLQVNGATHAATVVSGTQLTFRLTAAELAATGSLAVTLANPQPGGGASAASTIAVQNPAPVIASVTPSTLLAGSDTTTVALAGTGFVRGSTVQVNGAAHGSTYVSPTEIDIPFSATELAASGSLAITVANAQPGGGTSAGASVPVNNPSPVISAVSPTNIATGAADTVVTITGTGFLPTTTLQVDGTARAVSYVSSKQLSVKFLAAELTKIATYSLNVTNAAPGGGTSSAFSLYVGYPSPVITSLSPTSVPVGSAAMTLTINGTGFLPTSTVQYGSSLRTNATYVSNTQLTLPLAATDLANEGTYSVAVVNPTANGGTSRYVSFTVQAKTPSITTITPSSLVVNGGPYTINVAGNNISYTSKILWNGTAIPTTYYTSSVYTGTGYVYTYTLNGTVSNDLVASTGTASVTVSTSTATIPLSNALTVSITNPPVPTVTSISPNYAPVNADAKLTISGTGFTKASVASYNGTALTTTFNSATGLAATVPASLLAIPGNGSVTVATPAPGGGTSAAAALSVYLPVVSNNMVYNPVNGLAYLSIPSTGSTVAGNSVVSLDPATGALGTPIFVGSEPGVMAVSDDGKTLWVNLAGTAAIRKVNLVNNVAGAQYSVSGVAGTATAMLVLPGTTDSVAVTNGGTLGIYDAGVLRGATVSVNSAYALQADSSRSELYVAGSYTLQNYTYNTAGLTAKPTSGTTNYSNYLASSTFDEVQLAGGKIFSDYGRILDSESAGLLGSFTQGTTTLSGPTLYDAGLGQVYVLNNGSSYGYSTYTSLSIFSPTDYTNTGKSFQWNVPYYLNNTTLNTNQYLTPHRLTRWGANGLLLHTKYAIFTAQSNVVKDQSGVSADLAVSVAASGGTTTGSTATYTVTLKNSGPNPAADVALSLVPPSTGVITSTTSTTGTCSSQTGCTFGTLASSGSATVTVKVLQTTAGTGQLNAYVQGSSTDPDVTNNSATGSIVVTGDAYYLAPTLTALSPNAVKAGSGDTTIAVTGTNFASGSQVMLGTTALTTKYVSSTQLTATVPAANLVAMGWSNISISTPAPGGGTSGNLPLTVFNVITVGLNHVVYEPYSRKLYASVSSGSSTVTGSSIVSIDPATGAFGTPVTFSTAPNALALSPTSQTLYAALASPVSNSNYTSLSLGRVLLSTGASDTAALATTGYSSGYSFSSLAVQPGTESTLAIVPGTGTLALYDYDVASKTLKQKGTAASSYFYNTANCLNFLDAGNLLTTPYYSGTMIYPVTAAGFGTGITLNNLTECGKLFGNNLATPSGKIYNITTSSATQTGSVVLPNTYSSNSNSLALDPSVGSVFYSGNTSSSSYGYVDGLLSYDLQTYLRSGLLNLSIPTIEGSSYSNVGINDVVRWGQDGLALVTSTGHLYLLRGPFVVPQELTTNTAATLSSSSSSTLGRGAGNTVLTLTGTNFVPGVAVTWNGSYRTTTRIDATHVNVAIPATDLAAAGTGKMVATNPNAPDSNAINVVVQ